LQPEPDSDEEEVAGEIFVPTFEVKKAKVVDTGVVNEYVTLRIASASPLPLSNAQATATLPL